MKIQSPADLFMLELQDMYSAETQITVALPKMAKAASDKKLKAGFEMHLKETKGQIKRLEQIGKILDIKLQGKACEGMKGVLKEGAEALKLEGEAMLIDMALITGARKVEHYELMAYTSLIMLAKHMKAKEVVDLLKENMDEEEMTDKKLMVISKSEEATSAIGKLVEEGKELMSKMK